MKLTFRPRAEADLAAIWDYTAATWSEVQAEAYLRGLEDTLALLAAHPEMARLRTESGRRCACSPTGSIWWCS